MRAQPASYPEDRAFGLCLTHDVDHPRKFTPPGMLRTVAKVILRRQSSKVLRQMYDYLRTGKDPFWNFDQIAGWEQEHGFRSTFFLIAGNRHTRDPAYGEDPDERARLCDLIVNTGSEVGLHGSFESYDNPEIMSEELARLRQHASVVGGRQHYLRLDTQRSFEVMEQVGLIYDCTLAFSGEMGFRSGFAGPYYPFSLIENRPFQVLEIPLVIMDRSVWASCCKDMPPDAIWEALMPVLDQVRRHRGCVSVLWHNGFFDEVSFPGYRQVYFSLLEWLSAHNGWGASGRQVYDWFVAVNQ
jgi:hypothetical protein